MRDIRKYGLIDPQPASDGRIKLVMSKPLLRIVLAESKFLEKVLTGGSEALPLGSLPRSSLEVDGGDEPDRLSNLLATCRDYGFKTGEAVQLVSWLVAMHAWLLLELPPTTTMSLSALRPGAGLLGNRAAATSEPPVFAAALRAVSEAGAAAFARARAEGKDEGASYIAKTQARAQQALALGPRLSESTRVVDEGQAALMTVGAEAADAAVKLAGLHLIFQSKVKTTGPAAGTEGGDDTVGPDEISKIVTAMVRKYRNDKGGVRCLELMSFSRAPMTTAALAPAGSLPGRAQGAAETLAEIDFDGKCGLVITRDVVPQAMGEVFGGIAARCDLKKPDTAEEDLKKLDTAEEE